jgi:tetratricopeptide (TPR) repeat protein
MVNGLDQIHSGSRVAANNNEYSGSLRTLEELFVKKPELQLKVGEFLVGWDKDKKRFIVQAFNDGIPVRSEKLSNRNGVRQILHYYFGHDSKDKRGQYPLFMNLRSILTEPAIAQNNIIDLRATVKSSKNFAYFKNTDPVNFAEAGRKYAEGDYAGTISALLKISENKGTPEIFYYIAQCYEKLGDFKKASEFYKKGLDLNPQINRSDYQEAIARCGKRLNQTESPTAVAQAKPAPAPIPAPAAPPKKAPAIAAQDQAPSQEARKAASGAGILGIFRRGATPSAPARAAAAPSPKPAPAPAPIAAPAPRPAAPAPAPAPRPAAKPSENGWDITHVATRKRNPVGLGVGTLKLDLGSLTKPSPTAPAPAVAAPTPRPAPAPGPAVAAADAPQPKTPPQPTRVAERPAPRPTPTAAPTPRPAAAPAPAPAPAPRPAAAPTAAVRVETKAPDNKPTLRQRLDEIVRTYATKINPRLEDLQAALAKLRKLRDEIGNTNDSKNPILQNLPATGLSFSLIQDIGPTIEMLESAARDISANQDLAKRNAAVQTAHQLLLASTRELIGELKPTNSFVTDSAKARFKSHLTLTKDIIAAESKKDNASILSAYNQIFVPGQFIGWGKYKGGDLATYSKAFQPRIKDLNDKLAAAGSYRKAAEKYDAALAEARKVAADLRKTGGKKPLYGNPGIAEARRIDKLIPKVKPNGPKALEEGAAFLERVIAKGKDILAKEGPRVAAQEQRRKERPSIDPLVLRNSPKERSQEDVEKAKVDFTLSVTRELGKRMRIAVTARVVFKLSVTQEGYVDVLDIKFQPNPNKKNQFYLGISKDELKKILKDYAETNFRYNPISSSGRRIMESPIDLAIAEG